jgi:glycosyltransferase involved in cell wall biosynthesis
VLLLNVNRNQPRKDLARSILVAEELAKAQERPVALYLAADPADSASRCDLREFARRWTTQVRVMFRGRKHLADSELAQLYNAADFAISTSLCEGWGLSTIEAMACRTPVVVPNCSVFPELLGGGERGQLVATDGFTTLPDQTGIFRLTDVKAMARTLVRTLDDPRACEGATVAARHFVEKCCDWDRIGVQWHDLFQSVR